MRYKVYAKDTGERVDDKEPVYMNEEGDIYIIEENISSGTPYVDIQRITDDVTVIFEKEENDKIE